jgi:DNA-binding beta-propeller fold protein YncE
VGSVYVSNSGAANPAGTVSQYGIGAGGRLSPYSPATVAGGVHPLGVAVTPDGKSAYATNEVDRTVSQYDVNPLTGALAPKTPATVAAGERPFRVAVTPDGKHAYVTNIDDDTVSQYDVNPSTGALSPKTPATVAAVADPWGVAITPDGKSAYVTGDSGPGGVSQYDVDSLTGALSPKTPATAATGSSGFSIGVAVTPDGKSVYVTNESDGTVSQYDVNPLTGALSLKFPATVATGPAANSVAVTPDGKSAYVTNGANNTLSQYNIDPLTGALSPKTPATVATGVAPRGVAVTADGKSAYVANEVDNTISQYDVNPLTGALSPQTPATIATGNLPIVIAVGPLPLAATSTSVNCSPGTVVAGQPTACIVTVTDTNQGTKSAPTGTVSFGVGGPGSSSGGGSCTLVPTGPDTASCQVPYTPASTPATPVRSDTITATYSGDGAHASSQGSATGKVLSITPLAHGSFVIGDQNASVGNTVTLWGAQWSSVNGLSGGPAPSSFKGFASDTPNNPPNCGDLWTSQPGNSSGPPATVPQYMVVIASSSITKSGSTISGNAPTVVVVKTNPAYGPNPGHPGTGTVVGIVCP